MPVLKWRLWKESEPSFQAAKYKSHSSFSYIKHSQQFLEEIYIPGNFQLFICLLCFRHSSVGKESAGDAADTNVIPRLGRPSGEGIGYPLQFSWACLVA